MFLLISHCKCNDCQSYNSRLIKKKGSAATGSFFIFCRHSVTAALKLPLHRHLRSDGKRDGKVTATASRHAYLFRFYYKYHNNFIIISYLHIRLFCIFHCTKITFINAGFKQIRNFTIQKPLV